MGTNKNVGRPLDSESVIIRPLAEQDEAIWRKLWHDYLLFYETTLPEDVYSSTFARLISDDINEPRGMIAHHSDVPLGIVHYIFHRHCWKINNACYLQDLFTAPEARGKGVGRHLIQAVYDAADAAGAPDVYWLTQEFNYSGRILYDKVGVKTPFIRYDRPKR